MFTLLITGEGPADRRAITDSPQARGWERYKHPSLSPKCDGNVQLSRGSLHWQNPRVQREILKTWEELAELALTGGTLEKSKWEAGGIAKVSFKAKWSLDKAQTLVYTHKCSRSYQTQAGELHEFWSAKKASNKMVFISTTKTVTVFSKTYHWPFPRGIWEEFDTRQFCFAEGEMFLCTHLQDYSTWRSIGRSAWCNMQIKQKLCKNF